MKLNFREKGIPKLRSNSRGDQYVKVIIDTPKKLNGIVNRKSNPFVRVLTPKNRNT